MTELPITLETILIASLFVFIPAIAFWKRRSFQFPAAEPYISLLVTENNHAQLANRLKTVFVECVAAVPVKPSLEVTESTIEVVYVKNGAMFLKPLGRKLHTLSIPAYLEELYSGKGNSISSDAIGIVCSLQAFEALKKTTPDDLQLFQASKLLEEYVQTHQERNLITVTRYTFNRHTIHANF